MFGENRTYGNPAVKNASQALFFLKKKSTHSLMRKE